MSMRQSPILILLLWVASVGALVWLLVWPAMQDALTAQRLLSVERQKLAAVRTAQSDVEAAVAEYVALPEEVKKPVSLAAPVYPNEHDVAVVLERAAGDSGLLVADLRVIEEAEAASTGGRAKAGENIGTVSATVLAEGTYEALKQFIRSSESSLRIFDPQRVLIEQRQVEEGQEEAGGEPRLRFEVTGKAYFIRDKES